MLSQYERSVDYLVLSLSSLPHGSNVMFTLKDDVIPYLSEAAQNKTAVYVTKSGTASLHVHTVDVCEDNDIVTILLHYTDKNLTDPAFKNMKSGKVRVEGKGAGEGIAVSAHLAISLKNYNSQRDSVYLALLEVVPGLNKTLIERALQAMFNGTISRPEWVDAENKKCRPSFSLSNLASESLAEGLKNNRLDCITLISNRSDDNFDESELTVKETRVSFAVSNNVRGEVAEKLMYKLGAKAKSKGYTTVQVKYNNQDGQTKTGTFKGIDENSLKLAAGVFHKKAKVTTGDPIEQCQDVIHTEFMGKINSLLLKNMRGLYVEEGESAMDSAAEVDEASMLSQN